MSLFLFSVIVVVVSIVIIIDGVGWRCAKGTS